MTWFLLAIIAAFFYACAEIVNKYASNNKTEPIILSLLGNFYGGLFSCLLFLFIKPTFEFNYLAILGLLISSFLYSIGTITYYLSLKTTALSEFAIFTRCGTVILTFFGGIIVYRERLTLFQLFGSFLILFALLLLSFVKGKISLSKGALFALITAFLFAIGILIDKFAVNYFSISLYQTLSYFTTFSFLLLFLPLFRGEKTLPSFQINFLLFIMGSLFALAAFCVFLAYKNQGPITLTQLITQIRIPLTVIYGILIIKEREKLWQKVLAMLMMILGIYLLQ